MPPDALMSGKSRATLFEYRALRSDGSEVSGRAAAASELALDRQLERDGLTLVRAHTSRHESRSESISLKSNELAAFTSQLGTMIKAGIPLLQSLLHLAEHGRTKQARSITRSVLRYIEAGASLSEALAAHPKAFSETYVTMVRGGEVSGTLPEVLHRQGKYLDWVRDVKSVWQQAMIYPAALTLAIIGLVVILITFLIPRLVGLFPGGHEDLPSQTKFVMALSDFLRGNGVAIGTALVGFGITYGFMLRVPHTRLILSRLLLKVPRLGNLMNMLAIARFSTTASALHHAGCDILTTLEIGASSCGNTYLRARLGRVLADVRAGGTISESMRRLGDMDPYLVQVVAVGEASGSLGTCLDSISESYNAEIPRVVKWVLGLIEPLVLIVGGLVVAFLLLAAVLPIFKIYETLG